MQETFGKFGRINVKQNHSADGKEAFITFELENNALAAMRELNGTKTEHMDFKLTLLRS